MVNEVILEPGYGWEPDNNIAVASTAASTAAAFSSLLMSPTSSSTHPTQVATSKCTVKVPTESDFQFSSKPPDLSAINIAAAAAMLSEQPLRVVIPSPLPAGPDTTTATNSPIAAGVAGNSATTPIMTQPTTPTSTPATSSGKKTVFTAKGKKIILLNHNKYDALELEFHEPSRAELEVLKKRAESELDFLKH